ncbi:MAG: DUF362 domain-containing protein, partial [Planctomycetota bacterium]
MGKTRQPEPTRGRITRRSFIHLLECMGAGVFLGWRKPMGPNKPRPVGGTEPIAPRYRGRVVHVRDDDATFWDFSTGWYGDYVDQDVVDAMVEAGLKALTETDTVVSAWERLVHNYKPGKKFAIKVNFNNYLASGPDPDPDINALIEPVNAVIRTLIMFGVPPEDISVYDVTHGFHNGSMPQNSFIARCLYPGVNFVYYQGNPDPYSETEFVHFDPPNIPNIPDLALCNVVIESDYLINMPIPKEHSFAGVTLGFKNHMGSCDRCQKMHSHLPYAYYYDPDYSPLVDLFRNPHIGRKTVLTLGDCLFGHWEDTIGTPPPWLTFAGAPNSLFFSADPVSADSVMTAILEAERIAQGIGPVIEGTRDFLVIAQKEGMGIFEQGDPWQQPAG